MEHAALFTVHQRAKQTDVHDRDCAGPEAFGRREDQPIFPSAIRAGEALGPHLWTGISQVRAGAGIAVVGNPDRVTATLNAFVDAGCTSFRLSGYPHAQAVRYSCQNVQPLMVDFFAIPTNHVWSKRSEDSAASHV